MLLVSCTSYASAWPRTAFMHGHAGQDPALEPSEFECGTGIALPSAGSPSPERKLVNSRQAALTNLPAGSPCSHYVHTMHAPSQAWKGSLRGARNCGCRRPPFSCGQTSQSSASSSRSPGNSARPPRILAHPPSSLCALYGGHEALANMHPELFTSWPAQLRACALRLHLQGGCQGRDSQEVHRVHHRHITAFELYSINYPTYE